MERKKRIPTEKRDPSSDKRKIKKIFIILLISAAVLAILAYGLPYVYELIKDDGQDDVSYADYRFYEADYSKNILDDALYMSKDRAIKYDRNGFEQVLTEENINQIHPTADFFYSYINCIINGKYDEYPQYFTEACLADEDMDIPDRFTMQGLYDIRIKLHSISVNEDDSVCEIYEVSYSIFENNGTFRDDILPDETRTLVFELYVNNGVVKINAIGNRNVA